MSDNTFPLPAADYWRLVAVTQQVTIAQLEAKWAIAKAEAARTDLEAAIRAQYHVPPGTNFRLDESPVKE